MRIQPLAIASLMAGSTAGLTGAAPIQDPAPDPAATEWRTGAPADQIGITYVAEFDEDGLLFTPVLGRRAPRNLPVRFWLDSIRRGEHILQSREHSRAGLPLASGADRIEYLRSEGIVERYDSRAEGVEMSWVFSTRPQGNGDLVVRMRIDTDLQADGMAEDDTCLRLVAIADGECIGGVSIGTVTGVDAADRRVAGQLRFDGYCLEMSLPGDFLETADYPLVLDPLVSTAFRVSNATETSNNPDVAYDAATNLYCIVWEEPLSAADVRIFARRIHADTGAWMGPHQISASNEVSINPTIANVARTGCFVIAWERTSVPVVRTEVVARRYFANGSGPEAVTLLVQPGGRNPDLGGDPSGEDDEAVVVYEHDIGADQAISAADLRTGDTIRVWTRLELDRRPGLRNPAISKSFDTNVGRPNYMVVWEMGDVLDTYIQCRVIHRDMALRSPVIAGVRPGLLRKPDVAGDGLIFMVVAEAPGGDPLRATTYFWSCMFREATGQVDNFGGRTLREGPNDPAQREPHVAHLGQHEFLLTCGQARSLGSGFYNLRFETHRASPYVNNGTTSVGYFPHGYVETVAAPSGSTFRRLEIVAHASGTQTGDGRAFVVAENDGARVNLYGQRYEAPGRGASSLDLGGQCGTRWLRTWGAFGLGHSALEFDVTGISDYYGISLAVPGPTITCGACTFIVPMVLFTQFIGSGNTYHRHQFDVPIDVGLIGGVIDFQVLGFGGSSGPCPLAPILRDATNILRVTIGH